MNAPLEALLARIPARGPMRGRPAVTLSYAQSLDGSLADRPGHPLTLSSPPSMAMTHRLRAAHDAILIGIGTLLADDPRLTVRLVEGEDPQPVILDSRLRLPPEARILRHPRPPWIATGPAVVGDKVERFLANGMRLLPTPLSPNGGLDLGALLGGLAKLGVGTLMVEGGARVITSFLAQRLADVLVLTIAPRIVGGVRSVRKLTPASRPRLAAAEWAAFGPDLVLWGDLHWQTP